MESPSEQIRRSATGRAHLIGASGTGMRSLARLLSDEGWHVTGSDLSPTGLATGIRSGHSPSYVPHDVDLVVASDAVPAENCERQRAAELGVPPISYAEMLGRLTTDRFTLAVAGSHGKSTTSAMVTHILEHAGLQPAAVFGAEATAAESHKSATGWRGRSLGDGPEMQPSGLSPRLLPRHPSCKTPSPASEASGFAGRELAVGAARPLIVEACEYRRNFLHLRADITVITGIEHDHFDCYPTSDSSQEAFAHFVQNTDPSGLLLACGDCPATLAATSQVACRRQTFGFSASCDWRITEANSQGGYYSAQIEFRSRPFGKFRLQVPGRHNLKNALAAAALAGSLGVRPNDIVEALSRFRGVRRRLQRVGNYRGVLLFDDYAHHPTEVTASLSALREIVPDRRIWCVFQPHQVSRTARLLEPFAEALCFADKVFVARIFRVREGPVISTEITSADLERRIVEIGGHVGHGFESGSQNEEAEHGADVIFEAISRGELTSGDLVVTMGAGDIGKVIDGVSQRIRKNRTASATAG